MNEKKDANDNPASRLYSILSRAKATNAGIVSEGYAQVFGLDAKDFGQLLRKLGLMSGEADKVARILKELGETRPHELYLESLPYIKKNFEIVHFAQQWQQFKGPNFRDVDLKTLLFCADRLSQRRPEKTLASEVLQKLLDGVTELYEEVSEADVEQELKAVLLDQLQKIRQAINDYAVRGIDGLREAAADALLTAIGNRASLQHEAERFRQQRESPYENTNEKFKNPILDYNSFIVTLATTVQWGTDITPRIERRLKLFLPSE